MRIFQGNELIFKFMLINVSTGIAMGVMNFIIPVYALSLNATSTEIGLIKGISGIGDLLIVLPAGILVDYFGSNKMYSISAIFGAAIIMSVSFATDPGLLLFIMVFFGMSRTLRITLLNADFFKNMSIIGLQKGGWFKGSMTIGGSFIGPIIGGIAAIAMGFTSYFVFTSASLLVPLMVILTRSNHRDNSLVKLKNSSLIDASNHYKSLIKNRMLVSTTIIESVNSAFFITFTTFITVSIIRDMGLSPDIAAMLITLKGAAAIFVVFFCGQLLRRNNNNLYLFSFAVTILALLLLGMSKNILLLTVGSVVTGIGSGFLTLINFTQVGNIEGEKGKIAGIFSLGFGTGSIVGPILGGIIGDVLGVQAIFLAFTLPFSALAFYTFMDGKKPN